MAEENALSPNGAAQPANGLRAFSAFANPIQTQGYRPGLSTFAPLALGMRLHRAKRRHSPMRLIFLTAHGTGASFESLGRGVGMSRTRMKVPELVERVAPPGFVSVSV